MLPILAVVGILILSVMWLFMGIGLFINLLKSDGYFKTILFIAVCLEWVIGTIYFTQEIITFLSTLNF